MPQQGVVVTQRDLAILNFLFEQRVASHEQIAKRFFSQTKFQGVYSRLARLSGAGFISKNRIQNGARLLTVYGLKEQGFKVSGEKFRFEVTQPHFKSDSVLHDVTLVDIRERFEKLEMVLEYFSENVLQACRDFTENENLKPFVQLNSDVAITVKTSTGEHNVAIEYEASAKYVSRYVKKLTDYYFAPKVAGVFYICENAHIENLIRQTDREVGAKFEPKVFTSLREIIQNKNIPLAFTNRNNARFIWK